MFRRKNFIDILRRGFALPRSALGAGARIDIVQANP
jgi:hypothetical protein